MNIQSQYNNRISTPAVTPGKKAIVTTRFNTSAPSGISLSTEANPPAVVPPTLANFTQFSRDSLTGTIQQGTLERNGIFPSWASMGDGPVGGYKGSCHPHATHAIKVLEATEHMKRSLNPAHPHFEQQKQQIDCDAQYFQTFRGEVEKIDSEYTEVYEKIRHLQLLVTGTVNSVLQKDGITRGSHYHSYELRNCKGICEKKRQAQLGKDFEDITLSDALTTQDTLTYNISDCRMTNALFFEALKQIGLDVRWTYIKDVNAQHIQDLHQPAQAHMDIESLCIEDHAFVLWFPKDTTATEDNIIILDAYIPIYHGKTLRQAIEGFVLKPDEFRLENETPADKERLNKLRTFHLPHADGMTRTFKPHIKIIGINTFPLFKKIAS